jgi:hypothetical protein
MATYVLKKKSNLTGIKNKAKAPKTKEELTTTLIPTTTRHHLQTKEEEEEKDQDHLLRKSLI